MRCKASAISNTGLVRAQNEDNLLFYGEFLPEKHDSLSSPLQCVTDCVSGSLWGVFDGMGGHASGETASFLAAKTARDTVQGASTQDAKTFLMNICEQANRVISAADCSEGRRMGTTAAMLHIKNNIYTVCNVGDSPIFLLREGKLKTLSVEHTEKASYEAIFKKKAEPSRKFPLTQCLGGDMDDMQIEPHVLQGELMENDIFLLCSDGISDLITETELQDILSCGEELPLIASELEKRALEKGGKDNLTALCVQILPEQNKAKFVVKEVFSALGILAALTAAGSILGQLFSLLL